MKIILVGNGAFGSIYHQRILESDKLRLVGVVDSDPSRLAYGSLVTGTTLYSVSGLVEADAVVIATPPETHALIATEALKLGLHVFCSKPGALSYEDARRLDSLAKAKQRQLYVDYTMQSAPEANMIHQQVNVLGEPQMMTSLRHQTIKARPEGMLWDLACHDLACFYDFMDFDLVDSVTCQMTNRTMLAEMMVKDRSIGMINVACEAESQVRKTTIIINSHDQYEHHKCGIVWDQLARCVSVGAGDGEMRVRFKDSPDPITLSLHRFVQGCKMVSLFESSLRHERNRFLWVTMMLSLFEESALDDGRKVKAGLWF